MAILVKEGVQYEERERGVSRKCLAVSNAGYSFSSRAVVFKVVTVIQNQILIGFYRSNKIKKVAEVEPTRLASSFKL